MIGTILIAIIGYGLAASLAVMGFYFMFVTSAGEDHSVGGFILVVWALMAATATRWLVGL